MVHGEKCVNIIFTNVPLFLNASQNFEASSTTCWEILNEGENYREMSITSLICAGKYTSQAYRGRTCNDFTDSCKLYAFFFHYLNKYF